MTIGLRIRELAVAMVMAGLTAMSVSIGGAALSHQSPSLSAGGQIQHEICQPVWPYKCERLPD